MWTLTLANLCACAQVSRLVNVATFLFAEHLRGTPFLTWWYRGMVRLIWLFTGSPASCPASACSGGSLGS